MGRDARRRGPALAVVDPRLAPATVGFALVGVGLSNVVPALFSAAAGLAPVPAAGVAMVATAGYAGFFERPGRHRRDCAGREPQLGIAFLILCSASPPPPRGHCAREARRSPLGCGFSPLAIIR